VQLAVAGLLHLAAAAIVVLALRSVPKAADETLEAPQTIPVMLPRIVFFAPTGPAGGGGGGGGNKQRAPVRHAEGVGRDALTFRTARPPTPTPAERVADEAPALPSIVLDAKPLASGNADQLGLPVGGVSYGTSLGPGSGGGVGTGTGTGIGSGTGPGVGPGSGGGTGGGVYRAGGSVTAPRVIAQVRPSYTNDALGRKIQGSVWLELVVTREGRADAIRIVRSLDPGGLDEEAIKAVRQWRFDPGRLAGAPVDVEVRVVMDFSIR